MLDFDYFEPLTAVPKAFAQSYVTAASRTALALTSHAMLVWSGLLAASVPKFPLGVPLEGPAATATLRTPLGARPERAKAARAALEQPGQQPQPYATFRSAGGHASAQVIIAEDPSDPVVAALLPPWVRPGGGTRA